MSDTGFDCGTAFHPSPERPWRSASSTFVHMHGCFAFVIVAAIAHVYMHLADPVPDHAFELLHLRGQRVTIVGIGGKTFGADQPSASTGDRHTDLVAELIGLARLALGDALHLGFMHAIDLVLVVPLLGVDAMRRLQQPGQLFRWLPHLPLDL